jgi:hypothetical protein
MKYAVLMYADPAHTVAMPETELADVLRKHEALREELAGSGELLGGAGLALPDETAVLRLGPDGVVVAEGPLATEGVEHLTAYYEIDCETAVRARDIAARTLDDHVTAVEVRRIHDTAPRRGSEWPGRGRLRPSTR